MSTDDEEPSADELAEAEALARALEAPGASGPAAPPEALEAAALLRHVRGLHGGEAAVRDQARVAAAAARVLPAVPPRRPRLRGRSWMIPTVLVPAAVAMALVVTTTVQLRSVRTPQPVPSPGAELLEAQARAASGREDLAALDRQMRAYRSAFYRALAAREAER